VAILAVTFIAIMLGGCVSRSKSTSRRYVAAQKVERWDDVEWALVLSRVVTDDGYVDYDPLVENSFGVRDALLRYVGRIGAASPANRPELFPSESDRLAYYLNAHNALAMYEVVERGLPENVWLSGIFQRAYFSLGGRRLNLDELENGIIRGFGEPRTHFAVNWMSRSCPPMRPEPYVGARLDEQLEAQGWWFLSDARAVQEVQGDPIRLTELITRFYPRDFTQAYVWQTGVAPVSIIEAVAPYAGEDSPLLNARDYVALPFDWSLNRAR